MSKSAYVHRIFLHRTRNDTLYFPEPHEPPADIQGTNTPPPPYRPEYSGRAPSTNARPSGHNSGGCLCCPSPTVRRAHSRRRTSWGAGRASSWERGGSRGCCLSSRVGLFTSTRREGWRSSSIATSSWRCVRSRGLGCSFLCLVSLVFRCVLRPGINGSKCFTSSGACFDGIFFLSCLAKNGTHALCK